MIFTLNFECIYFWYDDFSFWILNVFDERMMWNWENKSVCNPEQEFYQIIIIKMFRQTLAHIKLLSNFSTDPQRAERAMFNCMSCSTKLCKSVLKKELLFTFSKKSLNRFP